MRLLSWCYEKVTKKPAPYFFRYSIVINLLKPIRKWMTNVVAANCPFNCIRILIYRFCGFQIGKKVFIGMKSYLDDTCYKKLIIKDRVTVSYGVYFACHGRKQSHYPIIIEEGAYIGMRASVISKNRNGTKEGVTIGRNAMVGACALVNCDVPEGKTAVGIPCRIVD